MQITNDVIGCSFYNHDEVHTVYTNAMAWSVTFIKYMVLKFVWEHEYNYRPVTWYVRCINYTMMVKDTGIIEWYQILLLKGKVNKGLMLIGGGGGLEGSSPFFQVNIFGQEKQVIFGQNNLIFGHALDKIFGQATPVPLNETCPVRLWGGGLLFCFPFSTHFRSL